MMRVTQINYLLFITITKQRGINSLKKVSGKISD